MFLINVLAGPKFYNLNEKCKVKKMKRKVEKKT